MQTISAGNIKAVVNTLSIPILYGLLAQLFGRLSLLMIGRTTTTNLLANELMLLGLSLLLFVWLYLR